MSSEPEHFCLTCGAKWSRGEVTEGCKECGGAAMEVDCMLCGGKCGSKWQRMVMDSNDFGVAHWGGACALRKREVRTTE